MMEFFSRKQELAYRHFITSARRWWEEENKHSKEAYHLEREMGLAIDELDKIGWPPIGKIATLVNAAEVAYEVAKHQCGRYNPNNNPYCGAIDRPHYTCPDCPMDIVEAIEIALEELREEA